MTSGNVRPWAYAGTVLGAGASIAANVAHVFVPPDGFKGNWSPEVGAILMAGAWPTFLLIAAEVLARKRWATKHHRLIGTLSVFVVALVAAVISYQHLHGLMLHYRETGLSSGIGPLAIDGLMIVCSVALVAADAEVSTDTSADTSTGSITDTSGDTSGDHPRDGSQVSAEVSDGGLMRSPSDTRGAETDPSPQVSPRVPRPGISEPKDRPRLIPVRQGSASREDRIRWARRQAARPGLDGSPIGWTGMAAAITTEFQVSTATAKRDVSDAKRRPSDNRMTANSGGNE